MRYINAHISQPFMPSCIKVLVTVNCNFCVIANGSDSIMHIRASLNITLLEWQAAQTYP